MGNEIKIEENKCAKEKKKIQGTKINHKGIKNDEKILFQNKMTSEWDKESETNIRRMIDWLILLMLLSYF